MSFSKAPIKRFNEELNDLETQLQALQGSHETTSKEYDMLKTQVSMDQSKIAALEQNLDDERKKLAHLLVNFKNISTKLEDTVSNKLREDLETVREEKVCSENKMSGRQQEALNDLIKCHQEVLDTEKAEAELREAAHHAELQRLSETKLKEIDQVTQNYTDLIAKLEVDLEEAQTDVRTSADEIEALKAQTTVNNDKTAEMEQTLEEERKKLANVQANFETISSQLEDTQKRIMEEVETSEKLREDLETVRKEKMDSENEMRELHQEALNLIKCHQQVLDTEKAASSVEDAQKLQMRCLAYEKRILELEEQTLSLTERNQRNMQN